MDGKVTAARPVRGMERVKVEYESAGERKVSIWEVRPGKRNRALVLISMWVKGKRPQPATSETRPAYTGS